MHDVFCLMYIFNLCFLLQLKDCVDQPYIRILLHKYTLL